MTCLGDIRSPLEASVQRLCNTRPVEVMCTWTNASLYLPHANAIYSLLRAGCRSSLSHPPPIGGGRPTSLRQRGDVIPTNPNLARMTGPTGLRLSSIAATRRRSGGDFSLPCAQWESLWLNRPRSRQSLLSREQRHDSARVSAPAPCAVLLAACGATASQREADRLIWGAA
jgi:hypothetical protein